MRDRRHVGRRTVRPTGSTGAISALVMGLRARATHRPVDTVAIIAAAVASLVIVINATYLQSGPRQSPFFANPASQPPAAEIPANVTPAPPHAAKPVRWMPARPLVGQPPAQTVAAGHDDPIGDLIGSSIGPSSRVMGVQRVLSAFGYGQIKPSGILDQATSAAIEKFESDHKLPVTGRISDRLLSALAAMTGRPIE